MKHDAPKVPYLDELRKELVEGITSRRRRRRVRRRAALGAAAAIAAIAVPLALGGPGSGPGSGPASALAITDKGEWIELRIVDPAADPARMTKELRDAGIQGRVCAIPAGAPDAVGTWIAIAEVLRESYGIIVDVAPAGTGLSEDRVLAAIARDLDDLATETSSVGIEQGIRVKGDRRYQEVKLVAPDLIQIRADFANSPQPGNLALFLGVENRDSKDCG